MMDPEMDDEVIADSEGEEEMLLPPPQPIKQTALPAPAMAQDSSHVSQFTENTPHRDSISNFTSAPATAASVPTAPKPRPRPKPNYKSACNADGTSSANTSISTDSTLFPIRDSIQAPVSSAFGDSMILSIADRAKMRSRDAKSSSSRSASKEASSDPPTQSKKRPNVLSSDIIELSSEDELGLPLTKPRLKPKLRTKEQPRISSPQPSLPMPTSSIAPSILPPSDPPSSSAGLPPIVTLPAYSSRAPSSSPFPSPVQSRKKKKKRVEEVDELDGGSDMPPPPPPFFASSSSEIAPQPQEVIDLSMLPPTIPPNAGDGAGASTAKKQTKPRKPRKKKGDDDDDGDDYVEGAESGKDKSQGKAKAPKEKKTKGKAKAKETLTDKAKSKGKQKEKEIFKSTEFVDDDEGAVMQNDAIVGWGGIDLFGDEIPGTQPGPVPQSIGNSDAMQSIQQVQSPTAEKRKSPSDDGDGRRGIEPAEAPKKKKQKTSKKANSDNDPNVNASKKATTKGKGKDKGKGKRVVTSDDEELGLVDELNIEENSSKSQGKKSQPSSSSGAANEVIPDSQMQEQVLSLSTNAKENLNPVDRPADKPAVEEDPQKPQPTSLTSRYTIAPRVKSTPMSELIRRVNSLPGSPFHSPAQSGKRSSMTGTAYSPYLKSSKSLLSRIAPLHPNRKDPPPPLPPPPPRKKTKKELEMEEQWEEELVESVGGMTEWLAYSDQERQQMRRAKRDREMYGWED